MFFFIIITLWLAEGCVVGCYSGDTTPVPFLLLLCMHRSQLSLPLAHGKVKVYLAPDFTNWCIQPSVVSINRRSDCAFVVVVNEARDRGETIPGFTNTRYERGREKERKENERRRKRQRTRERERDNWRDEHLYARVRGHSMQLSANELFSRTKRETLAAW